MAGEPSGKSYLLLHGWESRRPPAHWQTTSTPSTLHRLAAVSGIVLAALSATALVAASLIALI